MTDRIPTQRVPLAVETAPTPRRWQAADRSPITVSLFAGELTAFRSHRSVCNCAPYAERLRVTRDEYAEPGQPQWLLADMEGEREWLVSFWGGIDEAPEVAPRIDHTRWGAPLPVTEVAS